MMTTDEMYMRRCMQLAQNGRNNVSPNPMVGAVIVCEGKIIGEGYHVRCGEAHAEVNAVAAVKDKGLLKNSTIYVSLEPCSHHGKTPPCADLIIREGIARVVIGCKDPFAKVSGRGIQKLLDAGCEVEVGVLEEECRRLIKNFVVFNTLHRPYVVLKWAESADGFLDVHRTDGQAQILSTPLTAMLVHKKRAEADAIMVGTRTARLDNPSLGVRNWYGRNPLRVVIDRRLVLNDALGLFADGNPTLVYNTVKHAHVNNVEYVKLDETPNLLPQMLHDLHARGIQNLLIEGGRELLQSALDADLWDEVHVEKSATLLHAGVAAPVVPAVHRPVVTCNFGTAMWHYEHKRC